MKDRPIPMSAPMVRATLAGTKSQTRRMLRQQPDDHHWQILPGYQLKRTEMVTIDGRAAVKFHHTIPDNPMRDDASNWILCPYGQPGDRLWVREAWKAHTTFDHLPPRDIPESHIWYMADDGYKAESRYRQGMFMPRWASRITLEITGVRVERLQDISEADAIAEGIELVQECREIMWRDYSKPIDRFGGFGFKERPPARASVLSYRTLWESINGPESWDANPWVWCVEFKRVTP